MLRNRSIQIKAAFLAIVFGFNIVVGFACSLGINMGFNSHQHSEACTVTVKNYDSEYGEQASSAPVSQYQCKHKSDREKDMCVDKKVVKLSRKDKTVPESATEFCNIFLPSFVASFYQYALVHSTQVFPPDKYYPQDYHPSTGDLRISIQSFLI